ncbi:MAG TPA: tetratricopeptide repeat protein [Anaerolineales bacterium]|nr:tetratricopeptide repeat protein [Anaerolineales bacterium]
MNTRRLVPQFILDNYTAGNLQGRFRAVALLLDASGFSRMTDVLAQYGQHGAEVLAGVMRSVFDPMVENVHSRGGFVIGFAGDAFTALFPIKNNLEAALTQALSVSLEIQEQLSAHPLHTTEYGNFKISVRIGLGLGEARWRIIEAEDKSKATYYFHGTAIGRGIEAQSRAEAGEIIADKSIKEKLKRKISGKPKNGFYLVTDLREDKPKKQDWAESESDPHLLRLFWSEQIVAQLHSGEFRPAVNLFIGIPHSGQNEAEFVPLIKKVLKLQNQYGCLLTRPDYGDKGLNLLLFWGAPVTHENDVERALNFVLDLVSETKISLKAGVTYYTSFAGFIGGLLCEDYTCYGWGVNLSARMMSAANKGEIWIDEEITRRTEKKFNLSYIGEKEFKGFAGEHRVWRLHGRKESRGEKFFQGKFFGREPELQQLQTFVAPIWNDQFAGALTILGEAGIGKSRLVHNFRSSALFENLSAHWAICQTDEIVRQSLNPFRYWLRYYFGIVYTEEEIVNKKRFQTKIQELISASPKPALAEDLKRTQSFLGALVNLHWSGSLYEQLDAQGRYENTFIALSTLLRVESLIRPFILLFEDTHWADEDTLSFFAYFSRTILAEQNINYPIAILATSRSETPDLKLNEEIPNREINLRQITGGNLKEMAETLLDGRVDENALKMIQQRAEGNPFFIEQIVRYLREENLIRFEDEQWRLTGESSEALPADVRSVLIARLDRLSQEVRDVVQTASVLGREFEIQLLSRMLHEDATLSTKVEQAVQANIWTAISEIRYIFRHALMRDAAYNMQLRSRQQALHKLALEALEDLYGDELKPYYRQLAYHAEQANLTIKARNYFQSAGEFAAQAYQNSQAIEDYTKAIQLTPREDAQMHFSLLLAREPLFGYLGKQDQQRDDLQKLEQIAEQQNDDGNRARSAMLRASFTLGIGELEETITACRKTIELSQKAGMPDIALRAYVTLPLALSRQGQTDTAVREAEIGIELAQTLGEQQREGEILNTLGLIYLEQKEPRISRSAFEQSLFLARRTGSKRLEAQVLNNIGNVAGTVESDYAAARHWYEQSLIIAREIGSRIGEGLVLGNLGWASGMQGDFFSAQAYQRQALRIAREVGSLYNEAYTLINLSGIAVAQGDYATALAYANKAIGLTHKIGDPSGEAWAWTYLGHAHLLLPDLVEAADAYSKAVDTRRSLEQLSLATEPLAGLAQAALAKGDAILALKYTEEILSHLNQGGNLDGVEEPIRVYWSVYQTLLANRDPRADAVLENACSLLQEQIERFQNEEDKEMYVKNVPWRNGIMTAWLQKQA